MRQRSTHKGKFQEDFFPTPAKQTLRYAKNRTKKDPDWPNSIGICYGTNKPYRFIDMSMTRRTTRGVVIKSNG